MSDSDANSRVHIHIGDELPPRVQQVTQEGINAFHLAFGGSNPIHIDAAAASKSELGATIQHGARTLYTVYSMLFEHCPLGFASGGALEAKFIAPVVHGDAITCHCLAQERRQEGGRQVLAFEVWAMNQKGVKVLVGRASMAETSGGDAPGN